MDYIPTGAENAIQAKELCLLSGFANVRTMQQEIHRLRERGHPICASTDPPAEYYLAADEQEAARFVRSMESRRREIACVNEIHAAIRAIKKRIADAPSQEGR